ncbi:MAG: hypothetical protein M1833_006569 [Piccolia ochrophora]|nr:MAG: hypothetical protein M1833_006569 [Piccolia ochrophora]
MAAQRPHGASTGSFAFAGTSFPQVPASSPSTSQPNQYFPHDLPCSSAPLQTGPPQPQHQQQQRQIPSSHPAGHHSQHHGAHPETLQSAPASSHQRGGENDPSATSPFLRDLNLVAEAAKRAQMAVLMRDMEGVAI